MYAYTPPFPLSYQWIFQSLPTLHGNGWQGALSNLSPKDMQSFYVMIPMELRKTFYRRFNGVRWTSLAAMATATVVSGAVALYYSAPWGSFDHMEGLMDGDMESEGTHYTMPSHHEENLYESDDEPVDDELMDGFCWGDKRRNSTFLLVSSDPKSDLCHRPIQLDFTDRMPRLARVTAPPKLDLSQVNAHLEAQAHSTAERPAHMTIHNRPIIVFTDPFENDPSVKKRSFSQFSSVSPGSLTPFRSLSCSDAQQITPILKSNNQSQREQPLLKKALIGSKSVNAVVPTRPSPLSESYTAEGEISPAEDIKPPFFSDRIVQSPELNLDDEGRSGAASPRSRRSIVITEPDWAPFADTNARARTRSMVASLKRPHSCSDTDTLGISMGDKSEEVTALLAPAVNEDGELWFERFVQSTAATDKRKDWRRRNSADLEELIGKLEQVSKNQEVEDNRAPNSA